MPALRWCVCALEFGRNLKLGDVLVLFHFGGTKNQFGLCEPVSVSYAPWIAGVSVVALVGSGRTFGKSPLNTPLAVPPASRKPGNTLPDPSVKSTITRRP